MSVRDADGMMGGTAVTLFGLFVVALAALHWGV